MKKNSVSLLEFALRGTGVGFPVTLLCMILIGGFNSVIGEFLTWMAASALFGVISGVVFGKLNLNLPAATALHCVCCLLVASAAGAICGYADSFVELLLGILPVFVVVYVLIYGGCILKMKQEEKEINRTLSQE